MPYADTPMPGADPGALIKDSSRLDEIEPPRPTVLEEGNPEVEVQDTEVQPT
ncbi:hypothetical protein ACLBYF_18710 [Methylobacterium brachiatum]